jgi:hypothetical protein
MYLGGQPTIILKVGIIVNYLKKKFFLHWQIGRGKESLGNGYYLGLGCFFTLAEGKRGQGIVIV